MNWTELQIQTPREHVKALESLLEDLGAEAITLQDAGDEPVYEPGPGETRLWEALTLTGLFPATSDLTPLIELLQALLEAKRIQGFQQKHIKDEAWERTCLQDFHPIRAGRRLWICPSWELLPDPDAVNVILDPGLAFGTGSHPTTALCLAWLDDNLPPEAEVIDYGCGSGILSLAALKLGARHVTAVDHDQQAIDSTIENASRNHIPHDQLTVCLPDTPLPRPVDLVIANILVGPLIQLAPTFAKLLREGGKLALSGILETQFSSVIAAYSPWFSLQLHDKSGDWVCLAGFRLPTVLQRNI